VLDLRVVERLEAEAVLRAQFADLPIEPAAGGELAAGLGGDDAIDDALYDADVLAFAYFTSLAITSATPVLPTAVAALRTSRSPGWGMA